MSEEKLIFLKDIFNKNKDQLPQNSKGQYIYPFKNPHPELVATENPPETHSGKYSGAIDFIVAVNTQVLAAADGIVTKVVSGHTEYGNDPKYTDLLNYITIYHPQTKEFSQYCHVNPFVEEGWKIEQGMPIARTGLNGYMDKPHLHFFVYKLTHNKKDFVGLKPVLLPTQK